MLNWIYRWRGITLCAIVGILITSLIAKGIGDHILGSLLFTGLFFLMLVFFDDILGTNISNTNG